MYGPEQPWQGFRAHVGEVLIGGRIDEIRGAFVVFLARLVMVCIDVFRSIIDLVFLRNGDGAGVVTAEGTRNGHLEVGESILKT